MNEYDTDFADAIVEAADYGDLDEVLDNSDEYL